MSEYAMKDRMAEVRRLRRDLERCATEAATARGLIADLCEEAEMMEEDATEKKHRTRDPFESRYHQGRADALRVLLVSLRADTGARDR